MTVHLKIILSENCMSYRVMKNQGGGRDNCINVDLQDNVQGERLTKTAPDCICSMTSQSCGSECFRLSKHKN